MEFPLQKLEPSNVQHFLFFLPIIKLTNRLMSGRSHVVARASKWPPCVAHLSCRPYALSACSTTHRSASSWPTCPTTGTIASACTPLKACWCSSRLGPIWRCRPCRLSSWLRNTSACSLLRGIPSGRWEETSDHYLIYLYIYHFFFLAKCCIWLYFFSNGSYSSNGKRQ